MAAASLCELCIRTTFLITAVWFWQNLGWSGYFAGRTVLYSLFVCEETVAGCDAEAWIDQWELRRLMCTLISAVYDHISNCVSEAPSCSTWPVTVEGPTPWGFLHRLWAEMNCRSTNTLGRGSGDQKVKHLLKQHWDGQHTLGFGNHLHHVLQLLQQPGSAGNKRHKHYFSFFMFLVRTAGFPVQSNAVLSAVVVLVVKLFRTLIVISTFLGHKHLKFTTEN